MPKENEMLVERCPGPVHAPAIVSRCGGPPAAILNVCGHCGNQIVHMTGGGWVAVPEYEADRVRKAYA